MEVRPFALERYFDQHEFSAKYLLCCSDCEPLAMSSLLNLADEDSRRLWDDLILAYTQSTGHPELRAAIAGLYQDINPEDILVCVPEEGIFLTMQAILKPGDHIVCTFPGYQSLYELARAMGCDVSFWTIEERDGWRFSLEALSDRMRPNTRLVVVNFPHNPTGFLPDAAFFESMVDCVAGRGAFLLSDEMYRFLEFDAAAALNPACDLYEKALSLGGLSKSFGLPGLRLGWLTCRDRHLLGRIGGLKDYTTICASAPSEILGLMALRARQQILTAQRARLLRNISVMDGFVRAHQGWFTWHRPSAGSVCLPGLRIHESAQAFCRRLLEDTGILLVPSTLFDFGDRHIRIGYGREDFPLVLERLERYLSQKG